MNERDSGLGELVRRLARSPLVTRDAAETYARAGYVSTMFAVLAAVALVQLGQAGLGVSAVCVCGVVGVQVVARRYLRATMCAVARGRGAVRPELMARVELERLLRH